MSLTTNLFERVRFSNFGSKEEAFHKLVKDLHSFKVHLPEGFDQKQLDEGCGEAVCYIVNDLTNRELIRRKYTFEYPAFNKLNHGTDNEISDLPESQFLGSMIFDMSAVSDI